MATTTTATTANQNPTRLNICRTRQDDFPIRMTLTDSAGVAIDVTGFSFKFTVNTLENPPTPTTTEVFQSVGTIITALSGIIEFPLSVSDADQTPATYFFDAQLTDAAGKLKTFAKGKYVISQDVTK